LFLNQSMKLLIFLIFVCNAAGSIAQQRLQDVIYLKNGTIITGTIIEQIPDQSITIQTADGKINTYQQHEILKWAREPIREEALEETRINKEAALSRNDDKGHSPGYRGIIELATPLAVGKYNFKVLRLTMVNGYQATPYFFIGFGTGLRHYSFDNSLLLPVYADLRLYFVNRRISPYFSLSAGHAFHLKGEFEGTGFFFYPGLNISARVSEKIAMKFGLGIEFFRYQHINPLSYYYIGGPLFSLGISI
jgi:hypothetical protein